MGVERFDWPTVAVEFWSETDDVTWRDGKPRCAHHPYICLVQRTAIGLYGPGYVCAKCMELSIQ